VTPVRQKLHLSSCADFRDRLLLRTPLSLVILPGVTIFDLAPAALHWARVFVQTMLPWPFTIIVLIWIFFWSPAAFGTLLDLLGLFRKFKFLGAEVELNEKTKQKIQSAASDISAAIKEYRERMDAELSRLVSRHQLDRDLARLVDEHVIKLFGSQKIGDDYRCTVYIQDPVREGRLYQLLDYYPRGEGSSRNFSDRYGIIGKVWRSEEKQVVGNLFKGLPLTATQEEKIVRITQEWGMNRREAQHALDRPSYVCFLLLHEGSKQGLIYMDSKNNMAFEKDDVPAQVAAGNGQPHIDQVAENRDVKEIEAFANETIAPKVANILDDLTPISLRIDS
jgi:hypothetical protein